MHSYHRAPPYRPPEFAPCADPDAPIQLPANLPPARESNTIRSAGICSTDRFLL